MGTRPSRGDLGLEARPLASLIVCGIDPGTIKLGLGIVSWDGRTPTFIAAETISAPTSWPRQKRLAMILHDLRSALLEQVELPTIAGLETQFTGKNIRSALALAEGRGVAQAAAYDAGITVFKEFPPATVKLRVAGRGNASKEEVALWVKTILRLKSAPAPDAADALAVAICAARAS